MRSIRNGTIDCIQTLHGVQPDFFPKAFTILAITVLFRSL